MGQFNFVSPGGMAGSAIEDLLMKRLAMELQQKQVEQSVLSQQGALRQRDEELKRRGEEMQMQRDLSERQFSSLDEDRKERRMLSADNAAMQMMNSEAQRMASAQQAQAAILARAEENEKNRQAQAERANESNALRRDMAIMAHGNRQGNQDLQRELLQGRIDAQNEKTQTANNARDQARAQAHQSTQQTLDLIDKLVDVGPDGTAKLKSRAQTIFGFRVPHVIAGNLPLGEAGGTNALADLNRLKGEAIVGLISEMKRQSATGATGFGALSQKELDILNQSATTLANANISDAAAAEELGRLRAKVMEIQQRVLNGASPAAPETAAPATAQARQKWGRDASGKPIRIQ